MKKHLLNSKKSEKFAIIISVFASLLSFFIMALLFSLLLLSFENPLSFVGISSLISLLVSGAVCPIAAKRAKGGECFLTTLFASLTVSAVIFALSMIFSGGKFTLSSLMNVICYLSVALFVAKLLSRKKGIRRPRRR